MMDEQQLPDSLDNLTNNVGDDFNYNQQPEQDNSRWEVEYKDILESVYHSLRNEEQDKEGKWVSKGLPLINEKGASNFISKLRLVMHRGIALSNFDNRFVMEATKKASKAYKGELIAFYQEWGIHKENIRSIFTLFHINLYAVLSRAISGKEQIYRAKKQKFLDSWRRQTYDDKDKPNDIRL